MNIAVEINLSMKPLYITYFTVHSIIIKANKSLKQITNNNLLHAQVKR